MNTTFIFVALSIGIALDAILYASTPREIRAGHWWSYFPGSGFYAKYLQIKSEIK